MPLYCYKCPECGATKEVSKPMSQSHTQETCDEDGSVMGRDFGAERHGVKNQDGWPMASYAAGVDPSEVPEIKEFDKKHGVPTNYNEDGDPIFTSQKHRKNYCHAHGLYDRNAGYGDPAPVNR